MDSDGAHHHGGDRVRRAVAGVERGAAGVGGRAGGHGVLRRRHRGAVHPDRRLLHFSRPGERRRQEPLLRRRRAPLPRREEPSVLWFLNFSLFGTGVVYTLTSATSMRAIQKANCCHKEGHDAACSVGGDAYYMLAFGLAQVVLSQIPNFHEMAGLSIFAAVMSFFYAFVGVGLGVAKVITNGVIKGGIGGIPLVSTTQKVWRVSQAVGDIHAGRDTLRSPPPETETMKKATKASIGITTLFYLCCGCFGYAAFGFYEPYWLIDLANLCIALHLLGGYQVYTQPVFAFADRKFGGGWTVVVEAPLLGTRRVNVFRLCFRTAYVAATTALAVWFPYFNQVIGLLGAFTFWPLGIYFPVEMYLTRNTVAPWTNQWLAIKAFSLVCLLICAFASVGSAVGVFGSQTS